MTTIAAANPPPCGGGGITIETLKHVDLNHLTQHDLKALALTSDSFFDVRRQDDVVSPHLLDRSLFNESAGSRRQTYSRRLHHSRRSHSRFPNLKPQVENQNPNSDAVTTSIVHFIKHFLDGNFNPPPPPKAVPAPVATVPVPVDVNEVGYLGLEDVKVGRKRKRLGKGGKLSTKRQNENRVFGFKRVNFRGQQVDLGVLERHGDRIYEEELRKRTVGLESEEGALGFLAGLEGEWCSRRKKRKYVDTALFGDLFPVGWKVLLGLRRRDYRVSIYCRRFVSPTGQQFLSCKDVAAFLKSYFAMNDEDRQRDQTTCSIQQAHVTSSEKENDDCFVESIENLPEVQVKDIFECSKCNVMFEEKNMYLEHLLSFHEKITKRYKFGTPVEESVSIKDGCSDDLVIPISVQQTAECLMQEVRPSMSLKIDELFEGSQNPSFGILDAGVGQPEIINNSRSMFGSEDTHTALNYSEGIFTSDSREIHTEDSSAKGLVEDTQHHGSEVPTGDNTVVSNECAWNVNIKTDVSCASDLMHAESSEVQKDSDSILEREYDDGSFGPINNNVEVTPDLDVGGILFVDETQTFQFFPSADSLSNKEMHEPSSIDQNLEDAKGFGELRLDGMFGPIGGLELKSLPGSSIDLGNEDDIEIGFSVPAMFGPEGAIFDDASEKCNLTVCVWCRTEFKLEGIESETPSDSIGYMCPTCKSRIPGDSIGF